MDPSCQPNFTIINKQRSDKISLCVLLHRVKSKEDALYELPEKLKVKSQLKQSEEMLSNQMLSGIPEVNLGIQAKIRNIEATEEAKMKMIEERRNKKNQGPSIMVPTNVAVDFMQHNRCKYMFVEHCHYFFRCSFIPFTESSEDLAP